METQKVLVRVPDVDTLLWAHDLTVFAAPDVDDDALDELIAELDRLVADHEDRIAELTGAGRLLRMERAHRRL